MAKANMGCLFPAEQRRRQSRARRKPSDFLSALSSALHRASAVSYLPGVRIALLLVALCALALGAGQTGADAGRQVEAAVHREMVLGDLKGAIEGYRAVLALEGVSREIAARALFQMGQCQEKLGKRTAAEDAYRRVADEYGDQEQAQEARAKLTEWAEAVAGPGNLKFDEGTPGKAPPGWFAMAMPKDKDVLAQWQRRGCRTGPGGCVVVQALANSPGHLGDMMQSFSAAAYRGKTIRLRAWMRVEAADTGDHGQMWLTVERPHGLDGFSDYMDDRPIRSAQWTQCEIVGQVARDAQFINFGFISNGKGRVWVDDVSFEVVRR